MAVIRGSAAVVTVASIIEGTVLAGVGIAYDALSLSFSDSSLARTESCYIPQNRRELRGA